MKRQGPPTDARINGLGRRQLLLYAEELRGCFRLMQGLTGTLDERDRQIQEMAAASLAAQEEERQWIAYEVHDRIAQTLASVFQQLQTLESMVRVDEPARRVAVRASALLREAIRESRNIMNDLHPPVLDEFGIDPLIREELRRFQEENNCCTTYRARYAVRPRRDVEVALYRIFHEALINVGRHATGVGQVAVNLASKRDCVTLSVRDDGPGFDVESALLARRVGGLMSMRRRAEIIGGIFQVESLSGRCTTIRVSIPLTDTGDRNLSGGEPLGAVYHYPRVHTPNGHG